MPIFDKKAVSPVIAIVLLLMMTVAAAGAAYFWLTSMQSSMQESSRKSIENIMEASGRRVTAQATLCKPTYPYKGLVGYWMMDEGSGSYANDSSGYGNDGTLYPGSDGSIDSDSEMWTNGKVGGALEFDGNDSYVMVSNDPSFAGEAATIVYWWKPYNIPGSGSQYNLKMYNHKTGGWEIGTRADFGQLQVRYSWSGDWNAINFGSYSLDEWQLVVWTYRKINSTDAEFELYRNGGFVDSTTSHPWAETDRSLNIMAVDNNSAKIDEVQIYNRALSKNEIKELYEAENHSARRRIDVTVRNIGSERIPKATWVANLKQDGTTVETDAYNASSIDIGEFTTLKFYFKNFKPNIEYTIDLEGTGTSTTVSC